MNPDPLVERIGRSDAAAFGELFESINRPLVRYIQGFTRDVATAYDVLQDVFAKLWEIRETLPAETKLYMCHDYKAPGRDTYAWETTVGEQRERSVHIKEGISEDAFVKMRETRDATLAVPRLLLPSIQTNIRAGRFPEAEANGVHYLKIPVKPAGNVQLI